MECSTPMVKARPAPTSKVREQSRMLQQLTPLPVALLAGDPDLEIDVQNRGLEIVRLSTVIPSRYEQTGGCVDEPDSRGAALGARV